jgi:hypothetical protein
MLGTCLVSFAIKGIGPNAVKMYGKKDSLLSEKVSG